MGGMKNTLANRTFGLWRVISLAPNSPKIHDKIWHCQCHCGKFRDVPQSNLLDGKSRSCGCKAAVQNGLSKQREYKIWQHMISRCHKPNNINYKSYGNKGTYVCIGWQSSFLKFLSDVGPAPSEKHSLDRINTYGSYTCGSCSHCIELNAPANCRWLTKYEQGRNQKSNRWYTHNGKTMILKDWAKTTGISYVALWYRLKNGIPFSDAISIERNAVKKLRKSRAGYPPVDHPKQT